MRLFRRQARINLALQGGGAHGAFTWGVLDRLLEDEELEIGWVSATSAGAVNAVALAVRSARRRQAGGARQAAQRLGGRAQGRRARSVAPQSVSLRPESRSAAGARGEPVVALRVQSAGVRSAAPAAHGCDRLRQAARELAGRAADRRDRGGERAGAHLPRRRGHRRRGAGIGLPADAASRRRDRRRRLLGRRLLGQPRHRDRSPWRARSRTRSSSRSTRWCATDCRPGVREIALHANRLAFNAPLMRDVEVIETVRECSKRWLGGARGRYGRLATHRFHLIEAGRYTSALSPDSTVEARLGPAELPLQRRPRRDRQMAEPPSRQHRPPVERRPEGALPDARAAAAGGGVGY